MHHLTWDLIGFIVLTIIAPALMCLAVILGDHYAKKREGR